MENVYKGSLRSLKKGILIKGMKGVVEKYLTWVRIEKSQIHIISKNWS